MSSLSNRQSIFRPTSTRAAVAQQGLAQHITRRPVSGRFMASHLGVGRAHAASVDVLHRHLPAPVSADVAQFYQLRAVAERLKQQLAAHDRRRALTPKQAGYPAPFLTPTQQQQFRDEARKREREKQRLLEEVNRSMKAAYLPDYLRAENAVIPKQSAPIAGPDCFMPMSFWRTQYTPTPAGWKTQYVKAKMGKNGKIVPAYWTSFNHWRNCCNTVKLMVGYNAGTKDRIQIVLESGHRLVLQPTAARGFQKLDEYLALHKPVMAGVNHTFGGTDNEHTTDHFIAIVGTGVDAKGKYYRFFDVGTLFSKKGLIHETDFILTQGLVYMQVKLTQFRETASIQYLN